MPDQIDRLLQLAREQEIRKWSQKPFDEIRQELGGTEIGFEDRVEDFPYWVEIMELPDGTDEYIRLLIDISTIKAERRLTPLDLFIYRDGRIDFSGGIQKRPLRDFVAGLGNIARIFSVLILEFVSWLWRKIKSE